MQMTTPYMIMKVATAAMVALVPSPSMAAMLMFTDTWVAVAKALAMNNMEVMA